MLKGLCLLAPAADVGGKAELDHKITGFLVVVAFIQTQPLGGMGWGRGATLLSRVSRVSFMSCWLMPATAKPTGRPGPSVNRLRLTPLGGHAGRFPAGGAGRLDVDPRPGDVRGGQTARADPNEGK